MQEPIEYLDEEISADNATGPRNTHLFQRIDSVNVTSIRSPLPSQRRRSEMSEKLKLEELVPMKERDSRLQFPDLMVTPKVSERSMFGAKRRSETVANRNKLATIISRTSPGVTS